MSQKSLREDFGAAALQVSQMLCINKNQDNNANAVRRVSAVSGGGFNVGKLPDGKWDHKGWFEGKYDDKLGGITIKPGGYSP